MNRPQTACSGPPSRIPVPSGPAEVRPGRNQLLVACAELARRGEDKLAVVSSTGKKAGDVESADGVRRAHARLQPEFSFYLRPSPHTEYCIFQPV